MKYEKITEHEDWKDGHDAFRIWTVNKIKSLEWEVKEVKDEIRELKREKG